MNPIKRYLFKLIIYPFFSLQFGYSPLTSICQNTESNQVACSLHKGCLLVIYHNATSSFEELLKKVNAVIKTY